MAKETTKMTARNQALSWLASQLRWEQTLEALRGETASEDRKAA